MAFTEATMKDRHIKHKHQHESEHTHKKCRRKRDKSEERAREHHSRRKHEHNESRRGHEHREQISEKRKDFKHEPLDENIHRKKQKLVNILIYLMSLFYF